MMLVPFEQIRPNLVLDIPYRPAQRRLRDVAPFCGAREIEFLRKGDRVAQFG